VPIYMFKCQVRCPSRGVWDFSPASKPLYSIGVELFYRRRIIL
jgi:hypothetical protein